MDSIRWPHLNTRNRCHLPRSCYCTARASLFVHYCVFITLLIFFYVRNANVETHVPSWQQLSELYPGLIEPIRETWTSPLSKRKIYIITPTKTRPQQKAELIRIAQTFSLIPNLFWIVIEDEPVPSERLRRLLESFRLPFVLLNKVTPREFQLPPNEVEWKRPRGTFQRNIAIEWLRVNTNRNEDALVYFADDDNTYHWRLFQEIRRVQSVGVWPVGINGLLLYERPICVNQKVHSWYRLIHQERKFPIDMAGFAIHLRLFHEHSNFLFNVSPTRIAAQESQILAAMTTVEKLECLASNTSKIYVWHTKTVPVPLAAKEALKKAGLPDDHIE